MSPTYVSLFCFLERDEIEEIDESLSLEWTEKEYSVIYRCRLNERRRVILRLTISLCSLGVQGMVRVWPKGESLPKSSSFRRCSARFVERRLQP